MDLSRSSYSTTSQDVNNEIGTSSEICLDQISLSIQVSNNNYNQPQQPLVDYIEHYRNTFAAPENFVKRRVDYSKMKVYDEKLREEGERLKTFKNFPKRLSPLSKAISKSGFYYIGNAREPDKVKCIFCQGILFSWKISDVPNKEHRKSFPTCPFILNLNVGNEPMKEDLQNFLTIDPILKNFSGRIQCIIINSLNDVTVSLPNPLESDIESREQTFNTLKNLKHLSLEGLFINRKDSSSFITCSICFKEIELLHGVEMLPSNIFHLSYCSYKIKYLDSFDKPSKPLIKKPKMNHCRVEYSITDEEIDARIDARKVENILENRKLIKALIASKLKTTGKDYESVFELLQDSRHFQDNQEEETVSNYLEYILPDHSCVVCLDNTIEVVFLPCGHLRTCRKCSNVLTTCPVCRKLIEKRVYGVRFTRTIP